MKEQEKDLKNKEKKEGVRVYTWKRLTPLTGINTMRNQGPDWIYSVFYLLNFNEERV